MSYLSKGKAALLPIFRERVPYGQLHAGRAFRRPLTRRFSSSESNGNENISDKEWEVRVGELECHTSVPHWALPHYATL